METPQSQQPTYQERRELRQREKMKAERQRKIKQLYRHIVLWLFVALIVGGGVFGMVKLASRPASETGPAVTVDAINAEDWIKGNREAKVVLIEYSDLQCPACAFYYPLLKKLAEEFGDKLAIAYRHFPLPQHQNAKLAAYAVEAAGRQEKFWEMHHLIFDNQAYWKDKRSADEIFINYAQTLNLNLDQFKTDFASKEIRKKVEDAYSNAVRLGLNSTPTFFLNGKKISNPRNYEDFKNLILQAINASDGQ
jgi:protein-disulfide isomerase